MLHLHIVEGPGCVDQFVQEDNVILLTAGRWPLVIFTHHL